MPPKNNVTNGLKTYGAYDFFSIQNVNTLKSCIQKILAYLACNTLPRSWTFYTGNINFLANCTLTCLIFIDACRL